MITVQLNHLNIGLIWLFFLSFLQVTLDFSLHFRSIIGIGNEVAAFDRKRPKPAT